MVDVDESLSGTESRESALPNGLTRWRVAGATFFSIGAVSTAVQTLTALGLGSFDINRWGWSTGGMIAIVASGVLASTSPRTWREWWRRVWPWLLGTAILAFGVMLAAFKPATSTEGLRFDPAFALVSEWASVDEPAALAEVETGKYDVLMSDIHVCHVGQSWGDCINGHIEQYNSACAGTSLSFAGARTCENLETTIVDMQNTGGPGWTVTTLGGWGRLSLEPEMGLENIPAVAHVAVCYLGIFGECS